MTLTISPSINTFNVFKNRQAFLDWYRLLSDTRKRIVKRCSAYVTLVLWKGYLKTKLKILLRFYISYMKIVAQNLYDLYDVSSFTSSTLWITLKVKEWRIFFQKKRKNKILESFSHLVKIIEPDKLCPSTTRLYISKKTRIKIQERSSANRLLKYTDMENALYQTLLAGNHCKTILQDPLAT